VTPEALRALLRAAWQDGWQQRSNLHVAPLGIRLTENARRCSDYVEAVVATHKEPDVRATQS
jgi:hypothetical protein